MKGLRDRLLEQATTSRLQDTDVVDSGEYYQSVIDSVASVICTVDRDLRVTGVNRRWDDFALACFGERLANQQVIGVPFLDLMAGHALERWHRVCPQILDGQLPLYIDEISRERDGPWRSYTLAASPLRDELGRVLGITFVATDISQLRKAEAEMLKRLVEIRGFRQVAHLAGSWFDRRAFHRQVTSDIAHLFGTRKCIIFRWSNRTGHLEAQVPAFGLSGPELASLSLDIGDPGDHKSLWQDLEEKDYILLNEGDRAPQSVVETSAQVDRLAALLAVLRVSGRVHGAILIADRERPFSEQEGQLAAAFAVPIVLAIEDAELNHRLLERVRQLEAAREEVERLGRLVESIRVPLTVIRGYGELLLEGVLGPVAESQVPVISLLVHKTREVADALNEYRPAKFLPEAVRHQPVNLVEIATRAQEKWADAVRKAGLTLHVSFVHGEQYCALGDSGLLSEAFDALVENAVRSSPRDSTIRVSLCVSRDTVYARVVDSGPGLSQQELLSIWEPLPEPRDSPTISLAAVRRIVEGYGGHVWAESQQGQGTALYIVLPRLPTGSFLEHGE